MERYRDWNGDSNVEEYEIFPGGILIKFKKGTYQTYKYTVASAGSVVIGEMQRLAERGDGLGSFLGHEKPGYEDRW